MLIPIGHDKGRRRRPVVTLVIIAICFLVQLERSLAAPGEEEIAARLRERVTYLTLLTQRLDDANVPYDPMRVLAGDYGGIDPELTRDLVRVDRELAALRKQDLSLRFGWAPADGASVRMLLCAFLHGGWVHLVGNMLFLWLSGAAIEDRWGHLAFGAFYLGGALASAAGFAIYNHGSHTVLVGASGAVAACMGAFLIVYARVKIRFVYWWYYKSGTFEARALYALPVWFLEEVAYAYFFEGRNHGADGVAHSAHVGGFLFGMAVAAALKYSGFEQRHLVLFDEMADEVVTRHPELDEALRHEAVGHKEAALAAFRAVLAREPTHPTARSHALSLALDLKDLETARPLVSGGLTDAARDGRVEALPVMLQKLDAAGLGGEISDRSLAEVARVCLAEEAHAPLGVQVVRRLLEAPVASPLLPGLVWKVAEVQAAAGRSDLAAKALQIIVERFPMDPFADRARVKLARQGAEGG